jgi:hypothetical protein
MAISEMVISHSYSPSLEHFHKYREAVISGEMVE